MNLKKKILGKNISKISQNGKNGSIEKKERKEKKEKQQAENKINNLNNSNVIQKRGRGRPPRIKDKEDEHNLTNQVEISNQEFFIKQHKDFRISIQANNISDYLNIIKENETGKAIETNNVSEVQKNEPE